MKEQLLEKSLSHSRSRTSMVFESVIEGVITTDLSGKIRRVNRPAARLLGLRQEETIGRSIFSIIDRKNHVELESHLKIALHKGRRKPIECTLSSNAGEVSAQLMANPVKDATGSVVGFSVAFVDRSEYEQTQRELGDIKEKYRALYDGSIDGVLFLDLQGKILDANRSLCHMLGYSREDLLQLNHGDLTSPDSREMESTIIRNRILTLDYSGEYEKEYTRRDGNLVPVIAQFWLVRGEEGNPLKIWGIIRDITRRKLADHALEMRRLAEEALKISEGRFRAVFNNASEGIFVRNLDGKIIIANEAMAELTGYSLDQLTNMNLSRLFSGSILKELIRRQKAMLNNSLIPTPQRYELRLVKNDGTERNLEFTDTLLKDIEHCLTIQTILRDTTTQRRLQDNMRNYTREVTKAQEEERKRIAHELHDETSQALSSLGMDISSLLSSRHLDDRNVRENLENYRRRIADVLDRVHRLSIGLRPPMLEELGLAPALERLAMEFTEESKIRTRVERQRILGRFPIELELELFRIVQESLNNVAKHSNATEVLLRIQSNDQIRISIEDNGQGFHPPEVISDLAQAGKMGLIGMQERVLSLNGRLQIESYPGRGTNVTVEVPISNNSHITAWRKTRPISTFNQGHRLKVPPSEGQR